MLEARIEPAIAPAFTVPIWLAPINPVIAVALIAPILLAPITPLIKLAFTFTTASCPDEFVPSELFVCTCCPCITGVNTTLAMKHSTPLPAVATYSMMTQAVAAFAGAVQFTVTVCQAPTAVVAAE
jgi:hypothetical protein